MDHQSSPALPPRYLGIDAAAAYIGLSPISIRRLLNRGKLAAHKPLPGKILIDRLQLESLVAGSVPAQPARTGRGVHNRRKAETTTAA